MNYINILNAKEIKNNVSSYRGKNKSIEITTSIIQQYQNYSTELNELWQYRKIYWIEPKGALSS